MLDAEERVSGRVNYMLKFEPPGMITGKILRSPLPHARLVTVDGSRAERLAGASAVLTRNDFGSKTSFTGKYERVFRDQTVVAFDEVRFVGDPVAAVAADNEEIAEEALTLIKLDFKKI